MAKSSPKIFHSGKIIKTNTLYIQLFQWTQNSEELPALPKQSLWCCRQREAQCWHQSRTGEQSLAVAEEPGSTAPRSMPQPETP